MIFLSYSLLCCTYNGRMHTSLFNHYLYLYYFHYFFNIKYINNHNKLRTYALFEKETPSLELYLKCVNDARKRKLLTRFRIGVLSLRVESGRYEASGVINRRGLPIEYRICKCCDKGKVEDEIHFLLECPLYDEIRQTFVDICNSRLRKSLSIICMNGEIYARPIVNKRVCMERMTIEDLFKTLMGIQVKDVLNALASFVFQAYHI